MFKENGKSDEADDDEMLDLDSKADAGGLEQGIDAYVEAIRGKHAVEKGQRGRLKVKNVRGRDEDVDMEDGKSDGPKSSGRGEIKSPKHAGKHARRGSGGGRGTQSGGVRKGSFGRGGRGGGRGRGR